MIRPERKPSGNTLVLIAATTIVLLLAIGFLVFKFGNLTGSQREAQTAIDAAALQAAKEIAKVNVTSGFGTIASVDQPPGPNLPAGAIGINTALATARLDALIAQDIGNTTMQFLAKRDLDELQNTVRPQLTDKINQAMAPGTPSYQAVMDAYNDNARRMGRNDVDGQAASKIQITLGGLNGNSTTNIRVPNGNDAGLNGTTTSNGYYNAYTPVDVPGLGTKVTFSSVGDSPRIVDNSKFRPTQPTDLPTVVQVATDSVVVDKGLDESGHKSAPRTIHNIATAVAGADYIAPISTTYCVSFAGGFPPSSGGLGNSFDSVANLMNTSVLAANGSSGGNGPWGPLPGRTWFRAPGNGSIPPGPPTNQGFPAGGNSEIAVSTPSVALSFGMYDWLRSLGLRVNHGAMVHALSDNLRSHVPNGPPIGQPVLFTSWDPFTQPAYAAEDSNSQQNSCWLALPSSPNTDPRQTSFAQMSGSSSTGAQMVANSFGYAFAAAVCPPHAAATAVNDDGAKTTDGNDIAHLGDLQTAILKTNHAGECARDAGAQVKAAKSAEAAQLRAQQASDTQAANQASQAAQGETAQAAALREQANAQTPPNAGMLAQATQLDQQAAADNQRAQQLNDKAADEGRRATAAQAIADRADRVNTMGQMAVAQTYAIQSNFQALTSQGVEEQSKTSFTLAGSNYGSAGQCAGDTSFMQHPSGSQIDAMKNAILNSTSDDDAGLANGNGNQWAKTGWKVYTHASQPVISHHNANPMGMPTAYAQSAVPPNLNLMFLFNIQGNYQSKTDGTVTITPLPMSPFMQNATSHGQCHYVAQGSLNVPVNGINISFSVQARDQVAVGQALDSAPNQAQANPRYCHAGYNMSLPDNGGNDCPTLGGEWRLGCPIPGGCISGSSVSSNGDLNVQPCPPPPAQMG